MAALTNEQIAGMNLAQLRTEISTHYKKAAEIEAKYPGAITNTDDETEIKRLLGTIDLMELAVSPLEDAAAQKSRIADNVRKYSTIVQGHQHATPSDPDMDRMLKSPGDEFVNSPEFKNMVDRGHWRSESNRIEFAVPVSGKMLSKALVWSGSAVGGGFVQNDVQPGLRVPILQRELNVLDLIPTVSTTSDTIEYMREDTFTNAAAAVAEASAFDSTAMGGVGTKPESTLAFSPQTSPVRTIAHWIPVTNRMLADAPAIRGIIDSRLLLGLNLVLESQIISGAGTGENLTGILTTALNLVAPGADNVPDAIYKGRTLVRVTGKSRPTAIVMHPNDWQAVRLMRENAASATLGQYLIGPPTMPGPMTLWGLPVVESEGIAENTALVGDFAMGCMLFDREEGQVRTGYINMQFVQNLTTLLAELRAAFVVWRPTAFSRITGV